MSAHPAPSPSLPLFQPNHRHHLSEFSLVSTSGFHFGIGYLLALHHSAFISCPNFRPSVLGLRPITGLCYINHWKRQNLPLSPQSMALDFVIPFQTFTPLAFRAILAGYIQSAWILLEPLQTGYVLRFLQVLGGIPVDVPAPVPFAFDLGVQLRTKLNAQLVWQENRLTLSGLGKSNSVRFSPNTLTLVLALAEIEIAPTIDAAVASAIGENAQTIDLVINLITEGKITPAATDEMADAFDSLALFCDASNETRLSLKFAQLAIMLRAAINGSAPEFETRCLTTMARHARLSWFPQLLSPGNTDSLITLAELAYADRRAAFFLQAFQKSCPMPWLVSQNRLWSLLFKTLTLTRQSIVAIQSMPVTSDALKTSAGIFALTAVHRLQSALPKLLTKDVEYSCGGAPEQLRSKEFTNETAWAFQLWRDMTNAGGQSNPHACYDALLASPYTQADQLLKGPFLYWK